jgi:hypothetical protein
VYSEKVQLLDVWRDIESVEKTWKGVTARGKRSSSQGVQNPVSPNKSLFPPSHPPQLSYEKLTNFGSLGLPSGPIPFFANLPSVKILLASSKLTLLFFMIFWISRLESTSSPERESPAATLAERSKAEEEKPDSMSALKEVGRRE